MDGFRVWDLKSEKMYYDDFLIGTEGELYRLISYTNTDEEHYYLHLKPVAMCQFIIMRCSEIKDSMGQQLYENDIIECQDNKKYIIKYDSRYGFFASNEFEKYVELSKLGDFKCVGFEIIRI